MTSELTLAKSMETYLRRTYAQKEAQSKDEFPFWDYRYVIFSLICLYLMNKTNILIEFDEQVYVWCVYTVTKLNRGGHLRVIV